MKLRNLCTVGMFLLISSGIRFGAHAVTSGFEPIQSPSGRGGFDYLKVDGKRHRLLAAHRAAGFLDILNLQDGKGATVKVGHVQGIDFDENRHYFCGDQQEKKLVVVDAEKLAIAKEIKTPGEIDGLAYCPTNKLVYADHDDGTDVWVIDFSKGKIVKTIDVAGAPEFIEFNPSDGKLYQNVKSNNTMVTIDPATNSVVSTVSTMPAESPHGLAIDSTTNRVFSAGRNGKLVAIDLKTAKPLSVVDIAQGVDQIAFDPANKRIYCACKGAVSVVQETDEGARFVKNIPVHAGAHTLAIDPDTHNVWICYADDTSGYLEKVETQ
jgi:DNA-binding beta-propeller fold protein YncE